MRIWFCPGYQLAAINCMSIRNQAINKQPQYYPKEYIWLPGLASMSP